MLLPSTPPLVGCYLYQRTQIFDPSSPKPPPPNTLPTFGFPLCTFSRLSLVAAVLPGPSFGYSPVVPVQGAATGGGGGCHAQPC